MKQLFYILLQFPLYINTYAQYVFPPFPRDISQMQTVDSVKIRVWYAFNAVDINNQKTFDDLQRLDIGINSSKYFSFFTYCSDSLVTEWKKKNKGAGSAPLKIGNSGKKTEGWTEYYYVDFFKDFTKGNLTEYAYMPRGIPHCYYTEDLPAFNWEMSEDTITIAGYLCQKATCRFRGRDFTAWFTTEIPISNGPVKFGGLPGLILKIYDSEKLFIYECVKIENLKRVIPLKLYTLKYNAIDLEKYRKLLKDIYILIIIN